MILSVQVVFQLNYCVTGGLHCIILNYESWLWCCNDDISSNSQTGQRNTGTHCYGQLVCILQKTQFTSFHFVYSCLSIDTSKPSLSQRCLSQLSLLTLKLFYNNTSILHNTIAYWDIKIYRTIVKTLRFLEKLRCASMMLYAPQLGNQANDCFHFSPSHN